MSDDELTPDADSKPTQATILVSLCEHVEFFHDELKTAYATYTVGDHRETSAVRSRAWRNYLEQSFYETQGKPPSSQPMQEALGVMEGKARYEGRQHQVHVRVAGDDEAIYIDLGNDEWSAIAITANGWKVVGNPPVKFRRPKPMAALPIPSRTGELDRLRSLVNIRDHDWPLLVGWIIGCLRPAGPYPVLASYGEQGSAKSTTQRIARTMFDPSAAPLRSAPRNEHELVIAARNSYVLGFDNASSIPPWLSDAFARIATGAGFAARELYSNDEEMIFEDKRPILVNGIEEVVSRPDLLDRALILEHPRIAAAARTTETNIWAAVGAAHPRILAGIFDALSAAIRNLPSVELDELPRMADFCEWVVASETSLGWEPGRFYTTYADNRDSAHEVALDSSPIAALIRDMADEGFTGTASELLTKLDAIADEAITRSRSWPRSARGLSGSLRRLAPNLREVGVLVEFERNGKQRTITLTREADRARTDSSVTTVTPSQPQSSRGSHGDGGGDAEGDGRGAGDVNAEATCDGSDGSDGQAPTQSDRTLEAVLDDPTAAEIIRTSVDGEWVEVGAA